MPENTLTIGAVVHTGPFLEGLQQLQDGTRSAADMITVTTESMSIKATNDWNKLSDGVKRAGASVSEASIGIAEAQQKKIAAATDYRAALRLVKSGEIDGATGTRILAAAIDEQHAAAVGAAEANLRLGASAEGLGAELTAGAEEAAAGWRGAALSIRESLTEVQEKLAGTAERSAFTAEGIGTAFSGFAGLLGLGAAGEFAGHFLDELAKMNVELGDLYDKTGISVQALAGLKQITAEMGLQFGAIQTGLVRMQNAQVNAAYGSQQQVRAFQELGISMEEVERLSPEQMLYRLSAAFKENTSQEIRSHAALAIFGRGGHALIPILQENGDELQANMEKQGQLTGMTNDSVAASREWTREVATLGAELRSDFLPVLEHAVPVVRSLGLAWMTMMRITTATVLGFAEVGESLWDLSAGIRTLENDLLHLNFSKMETDAKQAGQNLEDDLLTPFRGVKKMWGDEKAEAGDIHWNPPPIGHASAKGPAVQDGGAFSRDQQRLEEMKKHHAMTVQEEVNYWHARRNAAEKGGLTYAAIQRELSNLHPEKTAHAGRTHVARHSPAELLAEEQSPTSATHAKMGAAMTRGAAPSAASSALGPQMEADRQAGQAAVTAAQQQIEALRSVYATRQQVAAQTYAEIEHDTAFEVRAGRMSAAERIQTLKRAAAQEYETRMQSEKALEQLDREHAVRYQQDLNRETQLTHSAMRQIVQLNQEASQEVVSGWATAMGNIKDQFDKLALSVAQVNGDILQSTVSLLNTLQGQFAQYILKAIEGEAKKLLFQKQANQQSLVDDLLTHAKKDAMALKSLAMDLLHIQQKTQAHLTGNKMTLADDMETELKKLALKLKSFALFLAHEAQKIVGHQTTSATDLATATATAASKQALTISSNVAMAESAAGVAAAEGAASAAIGGPIAAAAAASATYAAVQPFVAMAAFAHGGVVGGPGGMAVPILAHAGERVLTPGQTQNFERMVNNSSSVTGGNNTLHANVTQNFHGAKASSAKETRKAISALMRQGKLAY